MRKVLKYFKKLILMALLTALLIILTVFLANIYINSYSDEFVYDDIGEIPYNRVGLLLGTSKYLANGNINLYFRNRIRAAYDLFKAGKIDYIIVSGDNGETYYNEPLTMKRELVALGIPSARIYEDYAGFRTLDAVIRAREIFSQFTYTVISQEFHNRRAVFIARKNGIRAIAYNAGEVSAYYGFKTNIRELFARVKVFIDMLIGKQPRFLGNKIYIRDKSLQERLDKYVLDWEKRTSAKTITNINLGISEIALSGTIGISRKTGDSIPFFIMTGIFGNKFDIRKQLASSYVLLFWYRGSWCPYSEIQMQSYQEYITEFEKNNIKIFALSPEKPELLQEFNMKYNFGYKLIHDNGNQIARKFGIVYELPAEIEEEYRGIINLKEINMNSGDSLPLTATYLVDNSGRIIFSHIDADYRKRAEPLEILSIVKNIQNVNN